MITQSAKPKPPTDDKRWDAVKATMRRNGNDAKALIETLHTVQEEFGYLDVAALQYVAEVLRVPLSKVEGVATFYHLFKLKPHGKHTCNICTGTACYIEGAQKLIDAVKAKYGIKPGETTADGKLTLLMGRCLGPCGQGPVAELDDKVLGKISPEDLLAKIEQKVGEA